jgi:DNA-binding HxlR family transcriptional regulator
MAEPENGSSPLAEALARVGDRWTLLVVEALPGGPQRLNDLLGQIPKLVSETAARQRGN